MHPRLHRWRRDERGGTAVEFALISSVLVTLIMGIFNVGWAIYCGGDVRHGIERGSRIYITNPTATEQQVRDAVSANLGTVPISDVTLTITKPTVSGAQMAQLAWTYNYTVTIPFVPPVVFHLGSQILAPIRAT